jgi:hypothetical protein
MTAATLRTVIQPHEQDRVRVARRSRLPRTSTQCGHLTAVSAPARDAAAGIG